MGGIPAVCSSPACSGRQFCPIHAENVPIAPSAKCALRYFREDRRRGSAQITDVIEVESRREQFSLLSEIDPLSTPLAYEGWDVSICSVLDICLRHALFRLSYSSRRLGPQCRHYFAAVATTAGGLPAVRRLISNPLLSLPRRGLAWRQSCKSCFSRSLGSFQATALWFALRRISDAARRPLAMAPCTVPLCPEVSVASPAKNNVFSTGMPRASGAGPAPTFP